MESEDTVTESRRSRVTGDHLHQYDPINRAAEQDQELSDGARTPPLKKTTWQRRVIGIGLGVVAALIIYF